MFSSCGQGEWIFARIIFSLCFGSIISTREICASLSMLYCSVTVILSLSNVIRPPREPLPSVKMWFPFHLYLTSLYSMWVSCYAKIRLEVGLWLFWILLINCVNLFLFFRPRVLSVTIVNSWSSGPGLVSTSPHRTSSNFVIFSGDLSIHVTFSLMLSYCLFLLSWWRDEEMTF